MERRIQQQQTVNLWVMVLLFTKSPMAFESKGPLSFFWSTIPPPLLSLHLKSSMEMSMDYVDTLIHWAVMTSQAVMEMRQMLPVFVTRGG